MSRRASELVEHFFRHEYGRTVSALARSFGAAQIELIEDAVQTAMTIALTSWSQRGVPDNPGAWLTKTARNAILDRFRHLEVVDRKAGLLRPDRFTPEPEVHLDTEIGDAELRMLFVCCDEQLQPQTQLVLALKILCGFSVKEIALRLFQKEEAVRKRITRGRARFRALSPDLESPSLDQLKVRLPAIHQVLYLLFNEGYSSAKPDEPIRRELCDEAIRLTGLLSGHQIATRETWALLALMHLHHARLEARRGDGGELLLLEEQDRSKWNQKSLYQGMHCLVRSGNTGPPSRYHVEAAIILEHCSAESYEETNWKDIVALYEVLDRIHPSPLHTLNRAIAVAEWKGPEEGLAMLEAMTPPAWLARYYLWDATLGELYRRTGQYDAALVHLNRALEGAPTTSEKARVQRRIDQASQSEA